MAGPISAEIITTGTEILLGDIVDTNAAWIAQQLRDAGVNLYYKTTVGDNEARLRATLELGLSRSDVLLVTGGLGPTVDDITRDAIAKAAGRGLTLNRSALAAIEERFSRFGVTMTENNRRQAMMPEGAQIMPNPVGTAPGILLETERGAIIAMPGVPREMKQMMSDLVLPYLRAKSGYHGVIRRRVLRTIGIGESALDDILGPLMHGSNPTIGLAAKTAQADIRIAARAATEAEAEGLIEEMAGTVRELVGRHIYSETPDETIEAVVARLLDSSGATISLCESNTGGDLVRRIQAQDYGAQVLAAADMAQDADITPALTALDVDAATPDEKATMRCAKMVREMDQATFGLAILGTAGTGDGIFGSEKGVTWLALAGDGLETTESLPYGGTDEYTVTRIGNQGYSLLWQHLLNRQ